MKWEKITEDNPAPKTGRMFLAAWYGDEYLSREYPIWWDNRKGVWVNWPPRAPEPMLMFLFPDANTYFKEDK
jgi:hypothetical protein